MGMWITSYLPRNSLDFTSYLQRPWVLPTMFIRHLLRWPISLGGRRIFPGVCYKNHAGQFFLCEVSRPSQIGKHLKHGQKTLQHTYWDAFFVFVGRGCILCSPWQLWWPIIIFLPAYVLVDPNGSQMFQTTPGPRAYPGCSQPDGQLASGLRTPGQLGSNPFSDHKKRNP